MAERRLVADEPEALAAALEELAAACDVVVSTGGVSAGDADWIRPLLAERGEVAFWKLFLKPGRPFAFGQSITASAGDGRRVFRLRTGASSSPGALENLRSGSAG